MASEKLLPCPFCGSSNIQERANSCFCSDCEASGPEHYVGSYSGQAGEEHYCQAVIDWNTRTTAPVEAKTRGALANHVKMFGGAYLTDEVSGAWADSMIRMFRNYGWTTKVDAGDGWKPIETAPKNGTQFDVWLASGSRITNARWKDGGLGYYECPDDTPYWCELYDHPTHWMPLPAAPGELS